MTRRPPSISPMLHRSASFRGFSHSSKERLTAPAAFASYLEGVHLPQTLPADHTLTENPPFAQAVPGEAYHHPPRRR